MTATQLGHYPTLLLPLMLVGGCGDDPSTPKNIEVSVDSVAVTPAYAVVFVGDTLRLEAVGLDAEGDELSDLTFSWTSNPASVADVSNTGLVTAVAEGDATVTAATEGVSGQASITVQTPSEWNEPAGFTPIVIRSFNSKASEDSDRGTGEYPEKTGGSEGWDGFESREANLTIATAPGDPLSPGSAMRFTYPVGLANNNGPGVAQTLGMGSPKDLYVRSSVRLGPTYWAGQVSNKLYFHRMDGNPRGEPFIALHANDGGTTFRLAANFQGTPDNGLGWFFASAPANAIERETWYVIETLLLMNSAPGTADGIFRLWVDGELVIERTDVQYITSSGVGSWSVFHVSPTFGGSGASNPTEFYWELGHARVSGRNYAPESRGETTMSEGAHERPPDANAVAIRRPHPPGPAGP